MPATVRLYCFHYAGGSAAAFAPWPRRLPAWIDVRALDLPGHGKRLAQRLETSVEGMVARLLEEVRTADDAPFAFFGHSLGAVVAFEIACALSARAAPLPRLLFASGTAAPSRRDRERYARLATDEQLIAELERLGGTPPEVLRDAELMDLTLPVLRADFAACAAYERASTEPVACPIHVFGGVSDTTGAEALAAWREHTTAGFGIDMLPGGHFFLHERRDELLALIAGRLSAELASPIVPARTEPAEPAPQRSGRAPVPSPAVGAGGLAAGISAPARREGGSAERAIDPEQVFELLPPPSNGPVPLLVTPRAPGALLEASLPAARALIGRELERGGALLFRGFAPLETDRFRRLARELAGPLLGYDFGSTPRTQLDEGVYSSTEYPPHQHIPLHNEQSYSRRWPMRILFQCQVAAAAGGETPIADSREVYARMPQRIRERLVERGLMYVRNFGAGLDVPWPQVFGTDDRARVESYCREQGIVCEWKPDGELRTRQRCQVVARHPRTGEIVWFNQAHLFHVSALAEDVREALLEIAPPEELPRNVYYADGAELEASLLDEVRGTLDAVRCTFAWQSGDILMLDNMLVAHARNPFKGPRKVVVAMAEAHGLDARDLGGAGLGGHGRQEKP